MNRILPIILFISLTFVAFISNAQTYRIFHYDNGDDYIREGLRRIVDDNGKIGYVDANGKVKIAPRFAFGFPFENGVAKVTDYGHRVNEGEYWRWISPEWYFIDHDGNEVRRERRYAQIEQRLGTYIRAQDARIGVALIINGIDTVSVNGNREFPMLSVYKFPQAIAVADYCDRHNINLNDSIRISFDELRPDTWSPLRDKYGRKDIVLPISEVMAYSLQQSDNNACDALFQLIGGPQVADSLMKSIGYDEIHILNTEAEMHADPYLCYANRATPLQMAALFDRFYRREMRHDSHILEAVGAMMMSCNTGNNRLPRPLMPTNAMIGHKTGTGDVNTQGRIIGVNDAGYVFLPNKQGYAIAVFVADSGYDMNGTEKIIADISGIVFQSLMMQETVIGEYEDKNDGSTLTISKNEKGRIKVEIGLTRLTSIDDGVGMLSDKGLTFSATDAAGNPIYGKIVIDGNTAILTFSQSTWEYLPNGTTFVFERK